MLMPDPLVKILTFTTPEKDDIVEISSKLEFMALILYVGFLITLIV